MTALVRFPEPKPADAFYRASQAHWEGDYRPEERTNSLTAEQIDRLANQPNHYDEEW